MSLLRQIIATLVVAALSAPATAQEVTGSLIKRKEAGATSRFSRPGGGSTRAAFNAYGRCFAELYDVRSRAALEPAYGEGEQTKAVDRILQQGSSSTGECFDADSVQTRGSATSYAGAFAEFFAVHRFGESRLDLLAAPEWQAARPAPRNAYERFGACVVAAAAPAVFALAESVPDSAGEKAAIARVMPALSPCILKGQEVTFDRASLRSVLSVGLYRAFADQSAFQRGARSEAGAREAAE